MIGIMMFIVLILLIVFLPVVRCCLFHPLKTIKNGIIDGYKYVRYKRWNECKSGEHYGALKMYVGSDKAIFGSGKTLSAVRDLLKIYKNYNGKKVYNFEKKCWETQKIRIISNVNLSIPYVKLESTEDIINAHKGLNDSSVAIVFIDEAGSQFNSRQFKTNISSTLLNSMMQCRHEKFGMILTSPRYLQVDALMRQITSRVYECRKIWRFQILYGCSAWDLENCTNIKLVKHDTSCWFVENKHYNAYDTYAIVEEIKRKQKNGELLTDSEVLELQNSGNGTDLYRLSSRSRKVKKIMKK
ncbi:MAG: AAA family ATPase [Lachnospiraceae bacterium]|nr:AAA family ATPase [Lachnospiraceae bacterium]